MDISNGDRMLLEHEYTEHDNLCAGEVLNNKFKSLNDIKNRIDKQKIKAKKLIDENKISRIMPILEYIYGCVSVLEIFGDYEYSEQ